MIIDKNSPVPAYFQLQNWLIEQMEQGTLKPNEKIPTEEEINKRTGLARATIRQAIQNLVHMGYLTRKRRLGTFVIDRAAGANKQTIIGVLVPDIRKGYAPELARGAEDEAAKSRHSIILGNTDDLFVKADFHAERLIENAVSGVIFVPTAASDEKNRQLVEKFTIRNIPVVLADRPLPGLEIDFVTTDNFEGGYELTRYLILKGHKKIAIILSSLFSTERHRLEGYKAAHYDFHIPVDKSVIVAKPEPYIEEHYIEDVRSILNQKEKITAIFAGHDRIAYLFYAEARDMGISIPGDISIVGYDDLPFANSHPLPLTTMHQPIYEMGRESMKLVMARIHGEVEEPQKIVLNSFFVERSSVKPLNKN